MGNPQIGGPPNRVAPPTVRTETNPTTTTTTTTTTTKLTGNDASRIGQDLAKAVGSLSQAANPQEGGNSATADSVHMAFDQLNSLDVKVCTIDDICEQLSNLNKELEGFKLDNKENRDSFESASRSDKDNMISQVEKKINILIGGLDTSVLAKGDFMDTSKEEKGIKLCRNILSKIKEPESDNIGKAANDVKETKKVEVPLKRKSVSEKMNWLRTNKKNLHKMNDEEKALFQSIWKKDDPQVDINLENPQTGITQTTELDELMAKVEKRVQAEFAAKKAAKAAANPPAPKTNKPNPIPAKPTIKTPAKTTHKQVQTEKVEDKRLKDLKGVDMASFNNMRASVLMYNDRAKGKPKLENSALNSFKTAMEKTNRYADKLIPIGEKFFGKKNIEAELKNLGEELFGDSYDPNKLF
ncbi:MAG: hypothetical protein ACON35_02290 [Candidatus Marinamargulisbacteria bacterium]